jgi:hypothetical protein
MSDIDFEDSQRGMEFRPPHRWRHLFASLGLAVALAGAGLAHLWARL